MVQVSTVEYVGYILSMVKQFSSAIASKKLNICTVARINHSTMTTRQAALIKDAAVVTTY